MVDESPKKKMVKIAPQIFEVQAQSETEQTVKVNTDKALIQVTTDNEAVANPDGGAVITSKWKPGLAPDSLLRQTFGNTSKIRNPDEIQDEKS